MNLQHDVCGMNWTGSEPCQVKVSSEHNRSRKIHKLSECHVQRNDEARWVSGDKSMAAPQEIMLCGNFTPVANWITSSVLVTIWCWYRRDRQQMACELAVLVKDPTGTCLRDVQWLISAHCTAGGPNFNGGVAQSAQGLLSASEQRFLPPNEVWICSPSAS